MRNSRSVVFLGSAYAPAVWGTTYIVTSELLPADRPLLAGVLRALPAGLLLLLIARELPKGSWWWRSAVLGALNIGVFFALLFLAAYRLPGGVAGTLGAIQPLLALVLAAVLLGERLSRLRLLAAIVGLTGVALLVLRADAQLDPLGVTAALGSAAAMALGVVLTRKWGRPTTMVAVTAWQLVAGGLLLAPLAWFVEGPPPPLSWTNLAGFGYLILFGTALAYLFWFRGISRLPVSSLALLNLLSPVVAAAVGWILLNERLTVGQLLGGALVLTAIAVGQLARPAMARRAGQARAGATRPDNANHATNGSGGNSNRRESRRRRQLRRKRRDRRRR